jgi:hypothetical protein
MRLTGAVPREANEHAEGYGDFLGSNTETPRGGRGFVGSRASGASFDCDRQKIGYRQRPSVKLIPLLLLACSASVLAEDFPRSLQPVLKTYCFDCHNEKKSKGELNLVRFGTGASVLAERKVWRRVWEMLHSREMPPPEETQPGEEQRLALTDWIEEMLARPVAGGAPNPGHVPPRRLTAAQYNATVADLVGLSRGTTFYDPQRNRGGMPEMVRFVLHRQFQEPLVHLPPDPSVHGFDSIAESLTLPPFLMEKYFDAAEKITAREDVRQAFGRRMGSPQQRAGDPAAFDRSIIEGTLRRAFRRPPTSEEVARCVGFYQLASDKGEDRNGALAVAMRAILVAPQFLFRIESGVAAEEKGGVRPLTDHELATRLSYFLWNTTAPWLSSAPLNDKDRGGYCTDVSVDQLIARQVGQETRLPSLELGCDADSRSLHETNISWRGPASPMGKEFNPRDIYNRLFADPRADVYRTSILDAVREDAKRLSGQLGGVDKEKLDEYFESVRSIERRIDFAARHQLDAPPEIKLPAGVPADYLQHAHLLTDLLVLALRTDTTRVSTFMLNNEPGRASWNEIGVKEAHHGLAHLDPRTAEGHDKLEKLQRIDQAYIEIFVRMLQQLAALPEAGGTVLDHCQIVYGSGLTWGRLHNREDIPLLLAGGGNGMIRGGRHVRYRGEAFADLHLAMLRNAGVQIARSADSKEALRGLA